MIQRLLTIAAALGLAACAPTSTPEPVAARLSQDVLTVTMSDGQVCRGLRPDGAPGGWSGRLADCSATYPYRVRLDERTNPLRLAVEAVFAALTLDGQLAAVAEVEVAGPTGTRVFSSPPPVPD